MRTILRRNAMVERVGQSFSTINRKEKAGQFPRRVRLGPNSVGWYEDEVATYLDSLKRGHADAHPDATSKRIKKAARRQLLKGRLTARSSHWCRNKKSPLIWGLH